MARFYFHLKSKEARICGLGNDDTAVVGPQQGRVIESRTNSAWSAYA